MQLLLIPEDGLDNPLFETLGDRDSMEVMLTFERPWPEKEVETVSEMVHAWAEGVDWSAAGGQPNFVVEFNLSSLRIGFMGVPHPRAPIERLREAFAQSPVPLREATLVRRQVDENGRPGASVADPRMAPEQAYADFEPWWQASFDPNAIAPPIEDPAGMSSVAQLENGSMISELRVPLYLPGLRVCYGLAEVEDLEADSRCLEVSKQVQAALERSFGSRRPGLRNRSQETDGKVDRIRKQGRIGYAFALARDDMVVVYPSSFRYREYELLQGLREATRASGLEPVIHWVRDQVYIINLWERAKT